MTDLIEGQYELDGLRLGPDTPYRINIAFRGLPDIRVVDNNRALQHGIHLGPDLMAGRTITADIGLDAPTPSTALGLLETLLAKLTPGVTRTLRMRPAGYPDTRQINITCRRVAERPAAGRRINTLQIEWMAADPIIYSDQLNTATTALGVTTGGLGFPHGFPHGFGSALPGSIIAANDGNNEIRSFTSHVTAGPGGASNLTLEHVGQDQLLVYAGALNEGDTLTFDHHTQRVVLNGSADRYGLLSSDDWWTLQPGNNEIRFAGTGDAQLQLTWRHGWAA